MIQGQLRSSQPAMLSKSMKGPGEFLMSSSSYAISWYERGLGERRSRLKRAQLSGGSKTHNGCCKVLHTELLRVADDADHLLLPLQLGGGP